MRQLCELYGCTKSRTTPYHPQGNGACERFNQTILGLLSSLDPTDHPRWHHKLPALIQVYNNSVHASTGMTPHFVLFGRHARLPIDMIHGVTPPQRRGDLEEWVHQHHNTLMDAYARVQRNVSRRQAWDQKRYNRRALAVPLLPGERVLIKNFRRRAQGKLTSRWLPTPYVVLDRPRPEQPVYLIRPEGEEGPTRTLHRNNLRPCPAGVLGSPEVQEEGPPGANVDVPPQFNLPSFLVPPCPSRPAVTGVSPRAVHPTLPPGRFSPIQSTSIPIGPPRPSLSIQ